MLTTATAASSTSTSTAAGAQPTAQIDPRRYTFQLDEAGNMCIPGAEFGGSERVRVMNHRRTGALCPEIITIIMAINKMDRNHAAEVWRNFDEKTKEWIQQEMGDEGEYQFLQKLSNGALRKGRPTPVCTLSKGVWRLVMKLDCERAEAICDEMINVFTRYIVGDETMIEDMRRNARSVCSQTCLVREAMISEGAGAALLSPNAAGVSNAVEMEQVRELVKTQFSEMYDEFSKEFKNKRKLELYDRRMEEARRDKERRHELSLMQEQQKIEREKQKAAQEQQKAAQEQQKIEQEKAKAAQEIEEAKRKTMCTEMELLDKKTEAKANEVRMEEEAKNRVLAKEEHLLHMRADLVKEEAKVAGNGGSPVTNNNSLNNTGNNTQEVHQHPLDVPKTLREMLQEVERFKKLDTYTQDRVLQKLGINLPKDRWKTVPVDQEGRDRNYAVWRYRTEDQDKIVRAFDMYADEVARGK